jgi:hypothetical protein
MFFIVCFVLFIFLLFLFLFHDSTRHPDLDRCQMRPGGMHNRILRGGHHVVKRRPCHVGPQ